ncbi:MAG: HipA domain-containing protein [Deltaproteobacteria bacterium]|nr:HipA domain-containing protein [Deltaproteobacteria bacterium]
MSLEDNRTIDRAEVYRGEKRIGRIRRTAAGAVFDFDPRPESGLSFRMPADRPSYAVRGVNLHPFFAGLLPEGMRLNALIGRVKTSPDDLFSLCLAAGPDCIGDVSLVLPGAAPEAGAPSVELDRLEQESFPELFRRSLDYAGPAPEPSLPGVQDKISAAMISFPLRGRAKQGAHILKLNPADKPSLVDNELFFMGMARACGLQAAEARVVRDRDGAKGLLVRRFDRLPDPAHRTWRKVHVEDACQFTDRYPADKYRLSLAEIADGIQELASAPLVTLLRLLQLAAFSYLIANGDLHARNISLWLEPASGRVELSPVYDLLSSLPYGDRRMALKLDGRDDNLKRSHFLRFGERLGLRPAAVQAMLDRLCAKVAPWQAELERIGLGPRKTEDLRRVMRRRLADLGP